MISGRSPNRPEVSIPIAPSHHLNADKLQRDVRHRRQDAGERNRQRQPAIAEPSAHEVGGGDVAVLVRHRPKPRKHQIQDRVDHDRVRYGEEAERARAEHQGRHRDEGVGGIKIAADQEPGDQRAEATAAQTPLVQQIEVALAPARGEKAQEGNEGRRAE